MLKKAYFEVFEQSDYIVNSNPSIESGYDGTTVEAQVVKVVTKTGEEVKADQLTKEQLQFLGLDHQFHRLLLNSDNPDVHGRADHEQTVGGLVVSTDFLYGCASNDSEVFPPVEFDFETGVASCGDESETCQRVCNYKCPDDPLLDGKTLKQLLEEGYKPCGVLLRHENDSSVYVLLDDEKCEAIGLRTD